MSVYLYNAYKSAEKKVYAKENFILMANVLHILVVKKNLTVKIMLRNTKVIRQWYVQIEKNRKKLMLCDTEDNISFVLTEMNDILIQFNKGCEDTVSYFPKLILNENSLVIF